MTLPANMLDLLVAELASRLAPAIAAEFDGGASAAPAEGWRLLTLEDVCGRLGRSDRWVRERVKRGDLPHVRLDGGALAFDLEDVKAFAAARRVAPVLADRLQAGRDAAAGAGLRGGGRAGDRRVDG